MSYDYAGYHRHQYDPPQAARQLHPYQPVRPRRATCWDPPGSRNPPSIPPYDQPPPRYKREPYGPPQPHRMGSVQTHRPTCWDPPRQRTDNCYPPPYHDPDMVLDSYVKPRNSYARHRPWQPQYQPRPATKEEDPINAKLDRLLEAFDKIETWVDATNRWFGKFRSSPQPEPDLYPPNFSAPLRKMAYPPSRNNEASFGLSRLVPNDSAAPPRYRTKSDQTPVRQPSRWEPPLMATPAVDSDPPTLSASTAAIRSPALVESSTALGAAALLHSRPFPALATATGDSSIVGL